MGSEEKGRRESLLFERFVSDETGKVKEEFFKYIEGNFLCKDTLYELVKMMCDGSKDAEEIVVAYVVKVLEAAAKTLAEGSNKKEINKIISILSKKENSVYFKAVMMIFFNLKLGGN